MNCQSRPLPPTFFYRIFLCCCSFYCFFFFFDFFVLWLALVSSFFEKKKKNRTRLMTRSKAHLHTVKNLLPRPKFRGWGRKFICIQRATPFRRSMRRGSPGFFGGKSAYPIDGGVLLVSGRLFRVLFSTSIYSHEAKQDQVVEGVICLLIASETGFHEIQQNGAPSDSWLALGNGPCSQCYHHLGLKCSSRSWPDSSLHTSSLGWSLRGPLLGQACGCLVEGFCDWVLVAPTTIDSGRR